MSARTDREIGRLLTAMLTPFKDDGSVDYEGAQRLARLLTENGSDGVVVFGTTGEAPALTPTAPATRRS
jgi:4-hydroxy-tetrahydrodipicolinate synthase